VAEAVVAALADAEQVLVAAQGGVVIVGAGRVDGAGDEFG